MTRPTSLPPITAFLRTGALAGVLALVVNVALYYAAQAGGLWDLSIQSPAGGPITVAPVAIFSLLPAVVGALLAWVLARFVPAGLAVFQGIALLVFVAFLFPPFQLGAPTGMVWTLQLMHVVVAVPTVVGVLRTVRSA
jgi:hypothetical protein